MISEKTTEATEHVDKIIDYITDIKGEDVVVLDLRGVSSVSDFFIIATGNSSVHVKAIADEIRRKMKKEHGTSAWHVEGYEAQRWILLDYVDIVVHIFDAETRSYYTIEKLWENARLRHIEIKG